MSFPCTVSILESVMNHNSINKVASKFSIMHIDGMRLSIACLGVEVNVSLPISPFTSCRTVFMEMIYTIFSLNNS